MSRNGIKDQIAIVGVGSTGFSRHGWGRSQASLAAEACMRAISDAGLQRDDIDGVVGTAPSPSAMVSTLGLSNVHHHTHLPGTFGFPLIDAMHAIYAGACDAAVVYHSVYRTPLRSRAAGKDPLRRISAAPTAESALLAASSRVDPETLDGAVAYAAWAGRYLHETGAGREHFGLVAINDRTNAARNPLAAMRDPLSMDGYLAARMVRSPLGLLDMDVPVDGADAFVLVKAERARDLPHRPVLVHAATLGINAPAGETQIPDLDHHGQHVVTRQLRRKSDLGLTETDVYFPYDGFSFIALAWMESTGWCAKGEAGGFIAGNWDSGRILIGGRVPVNPHGGSLSEGGTQGSGQVREAVTQLRGAAGDRQVRDARTALVNVGGFFFNASGFVLRSE